MKRLLRIFAGFIIVILVLILSQVRFDIPVEELKKQYADTESKFLSIQGLNVHYKVEGSGPYLVLIHGTASSLHTWDSWVNELKSDFTVVRMDLPAFGLTGPNEDNVYNMDVYTSFIHELVQALSIDSFFLAGNSLGGNIAWNYTLRYPEQVKKLILIDASGYPIGDRKPPLAFRLGRTPGLNVLMHYVSPKFLFRKSILDVYGDDTKVTDSLIQRYYDLSLREGNREALVARMNQLHYPNSDEIQNISVPTLIQWGSDDKWIPVEDAHKFESDISGAVLQIYNGVGHVPMEEIPVRTAQDARQFLLAN